MGRARQLNFEGDLDIGGTVKVKWGKQKKVYEGEVIDFHYINDSDSQHVYTLLDSSSRNGTPSYIWVTFWIAAAPTRSLCRTDGPT